VASFRIRALYAAPVRWVRGLWPDGNPLRRPVDRLEALIAICVLVAFGMGAPLAAMTAWRSSYAGGLARQHAERSAWHPVTAVLLANATTHGMIRGMTPVAAVRARWTAPDGVVRTGRLYAPIGTHAGSTQRIWVTASGRLTSGPLRDFQVVNQAEFAGFGAVAGTGIALLAGVIIAHRLLDRRRRAAWAADWQVTGPLWTSMR